MAFCCWIVLLCAHVAIADYTERLTIRPLPSSRKVLGHFDFRTEVAVTDPSSDDNAYPIVIQQILTKYQVESFHLTFVVGKYADRFYGPAADVIQGPFGTRLQVKLRPDESVSPLERWKGITSELGGVFSASLNQMDETVVTDLLQGSTPHHLGAYIVNNSSSSSLFLHGALAREEVCTENLTPWLKMLPCRSIAGIGKLIDPINVLSGEYLSLSIFASRSQNGEKWAIHQHLTTVQPLASNVKDQPSIGSVFFESLPPEDTVVDSCPLATESFLHVEALPDFEQRQIPMASSLATRKELGGRVTNLKEHPISVSVAWDLYSADHRSEPSFEAINARHDVVSVHRYITGYGQVRGGIAVQLTNNHPSCAMEVTYHDVLPWYLRIYFSTFRAKTLTLSGTIGPKAEELIRSFDFVPAELRNRPNQIHLETILPANTSLVFSIQLEKTFLPLSEHPPDANRGFDIPPGVATFQVISPDAKDTLCGVLNADGKAFTKTLFTEPLLVPLPTPDFSMPYNVITMTSTVVAFFVGSMLNTLLRKPPRIKQMMAEETKKQT